MKIFRNRAFELLEALEINEGELSEEDAKKKYVNLIEEAFHNIEDSFDVEHLKEFIKVIEKVGTFIST